MMHQSARSLIAWMGALLICLIAPSLASSSEVVLGLDDARALPSGAEDPVVYAVGTSPFGFDPTSFTSQSGSAFPEQFDLHGEYSSSLLIPNGQVRTVNFNFVGEPEGGPAQAGFIGDTLNLVFTGHTPTATDPSNISVDLHFRSDPNEVTPLPALANGISVPETFGFIPLDARIVDAGGPPDFHISVQSAVPEPSSLIMGLTAALIGLGCAWSRRKRASA
jgi:hypothetical protein